MAAELRMGTDFEAASAYVLAPVLVVGVVIGFALELTAVHGLGGREF
jgi:hypothetical protein